MTPTTTPRTSVGSGQYCASITTVCDCESCKAAATKAAQVAAIRQRLSDIRAGAFNEPTNCATSWLCQTMWRSFVATVEHTFKTTLPPEYQAYCTHLDSLAAWLWERGCR